MATSDSSGKGIRIGVLIIGSLYWDEKEHRETWRRDRLVDLGDATRVHVPIRYGRLSRKRGCTYTMVFSRQLDDPNTPRTDCCAFVVPCKTLVNSLEDLVDEARRLWRAEADVENGRISAKWGCVALLEHPKRPMPDDLRAGWKEHVQQEQHYGALNSARGEATVVDEEGFLTISWPRAVDDSDIEVDALLATATDPTLIRGDYPSAQEIAAAWNAHEGDDYECYVQYFHKNRDRKIWTFQDGEIEERLRPSQQVSSHTRSDK